MLTRRVLFFNRRVCVLLCMTIEGAVAAENGVTPDNGYGELQEVVVVAQKRSENLQKVPIAVSVLDNTQLATSGVNTTQDLALAVPGLQVLNIAGDVTPRLRGVGTGAAAAGIEGAVATYIDNVYYAYGADVVMDLSDVSQVSVLKGPQGTLFGRNATGGVLQITTRDPTQEFHASAMTGLDNYLTWRSGAYVAGGLTEKIAAGIAIQYTTQKDGWGTNINDGSQTFKIDHDSSVRAKLIYDPTEQTTIKLAGDYTDRGGNPSANFRPFPGYGALLPAPQSSRLWDTDDYLSSRSWYRGGGTSLTIAQELPFAKLTSISAYRSSGIQFSFTPAITNVPSLDLTVPEHSSQFSEELQLVSNSSGALTWATGLYYFYNRADQAQDVFFHGAFVAPFSVIYSPAAQDTRSIAGFGQGTYRIAETTRLTVGLRYTYEKKTFVGQTDGILPDGTNIVLAPNLVAPSNALQYERPTWRVSLDHDFTEDMVGYVSYNRGFKSGGFNIRAPGSPPFKPEQLDAYEIGLKNQLFEHRARLNLAAFYYDYKEIQVPIFGVTETIINGAAARIYGLDEDFEANVTDTIRVNASANYLHARFTSFPNAPFSIPNPGNEGATLISGNATGNTLPYSPTFTYTLGIDYLLRTAFGGFTFNVNDSYDSGFYGEADNRLRQQSYHLLNSSVAWKSSDSHTTVRIYCNNMLDKAVASQFASIANGYIADYSNPPRIYGFKIQYDF